MRNYAKIILALMMALTAMLSLAACTQNESPDTSAASQSSSDSGEESALWANATYKENTTLGEGERSITVKVEADGKSVTFTVKTNSDNLGQAIMDCGLVEGEMGQYGLYIKKVNGIVADYDTDKHYWAISKGGVDLMTGADGEKISGGESYELVRKK